MRRARLVGVHGHDALRQGQSVGPHPFPQCPYFQSIIGREARAQVLQSRPANCRHASSPCVGGAPKRLRYLAGFSTTLRWKLIGVEAVAWGSILVSQAARLPARGRHRRGAGLQNLLSAERRGADAADAFRRRWPGLYWCGAYPGLSAPELAAYASKPPQTRRF